MYNHTNEIDIHWTLDLCVVVRDLESSASKKKKRFFGVFFKAPIFLGKWFGVATYFLYKKNKKKKTKYNITELFSSLIE